MKDFSSETLSLLCNTFESFSEWAAVSLIVAYFFLRQMVNFHSTDVRQSVCTLWGVHRVWNTIQSVRYSILALKKKLYLESRQNSFGPTASVAFESFFHLPPT